jgi:hypothetical protein
MRSQLATALFLALASPSLVACGDAIDASEQHHSEGPKLQYLEYDVLFTNPVCARYEFGADQEVFSNAGEELLAKPENVFCKKADGEASGARPESPQHRLLEWINDPETTEIFFTYLSFSNTTVLDALCTAIEERDVKVSFVLDKNTNKKRAEELLECQPGSGDAERAPRFETRGHVSGIGYAHNKMFLVNPGADTMKIAVSSGNMSSGVVLHHENWHFLTVPSDTYFAQAHLCLMEAELDHASSKGVFRPFVRECRAAIPYKEERDMHVFFVPADNKQASKTLLGAIEDAEAIDVAAHRFTYTTMVNTFKDRLDGEDPPEVRMVVDDDMYWAGVEDEVGPNLRFEYFHAKSLSDRGAEVRWMETNHNSHLLHHNKFMVFHMPGDQPPTAFFGAGNFTGTAFDENWENFYYTTIPHVVEAMQLQHEHLFNDLATVDDDMPTHNVMPEG